MEEYLKIIRENMGMFIANYLKEFKVENVEGADEISSYILDIFPYLSTLYLIKMNCDEGELEAFILQHKEALHAESQKLKSGVGDFIMDSSVIEPLQEKTKSLEKENDKLHNQVSVLTQKIKFLSDTVAFLNKSNTTLSDEIKSLKEEIESLKAKPKYDPVIERLLSNMVYVEGGSFHMGSDDGYANEKPVHLERVESFHIGKYQVTQKEWQTVMGNNPSGHKGENRPVERVSWDDCQEFIRRLNQKTGKNFRLPTEAEWEYAARGGNKSRGYKYSGSNDIDEVAWYAGNSGDTHSVGHKLPNELGLYDMSGNVWEWCSDNWCSSYSSPRNSANRVNRGGSYFSSAGSCRVAFRYDYAQGLSFNYLGLRLVL